MLPTESEAGTLWKCMRCLCESDLEDTGLLEKLFLIQGKCPTCHRLNSLIRIGFTEASDEEYGGSLTSGEN